MFEQESTPWHRSLATMIVATIILPPAGILLVWLRRDLDARKKIAASLCIAALGVGYLYAFSGFTRLRSNASEAHYDALERHRAEQQRQMPDGAAAQIVDASAQSDAAATDAGQPAAPVLQSGSEQGAPAVATNGQPVAAPNAQQQAPASSQAAPQKASRGGRSNYWTSFRGPAQDGRYDEMAIKTNWSSAGLPLLWKQPVGGGYASFVVADGMAFTIEQRRRQEVVAAYNVENGKELWTHGWNAEFVESMGGDGPRATPTWEGGRLYALGAEGELRCLDARTGKMLWQRNILTDNQARNIQWGMSAAPLIVDDKVIVLPGGSSGKSIVAYNKMTGAPVWKSQSDEASYTSPMLVTLAGKRQVIVVTARRIVGVAPEDGALLWETPWANSASINVSQPVVIDSNRFFISAGYGKGAGLVEVTGGGKNFTARKLWENGSMKNKFNSSVHHNGYVYGLDEGILSCVDVATGERKWKGGRYGYGQLLLASGHLIVISDTGDLALVKADPAQHTEVARFSAISGKTWNYPAIADGRLLVRNSNEMACFNLAAR